MFSGLGNNRCHQYVYATPTLASVNKDFNGSHGINWSNSNLRATYNLENMARLWTCQCFEIKTFKENRNPENPR